MIFAHTAEMCNTSFMYLYFCFFLSRYPGSTFMDHVLRYQDTPGVKMIVVLGEVGAASEHSVLIGCVACE